MRWLWAHRGPSDFCRAERLLRREHQQRFDLLRCRLGRWHGGSANHLRWAVSLLPRLSQSWELLHFADHLRHARERLCVLEPHRLWHCDGRWRRIPPAAASARSLSAAAASALPGQPAAAAAASAGLPASRAALSAPRALLLQERLPILLHSVPAAA